MRKLGLILSFLILSFALQAQELRCNVAVNYNKIKSANPNTFKEMQTALTQFMNERKWTADVFDKSERIACNIMIQLEEQIATNEFKGTVNVQMSRPVYNASYESPVLNIKDNNFHAVYSEFEPLVYNESSNTNNLTSILAYYAYIILGMDYDSFSPNAGAQYFEKAMQIVNDAQSTSYAGWKSYESENNRYWLAENLTNKAYSAFRQLTYDYHRKGMDLMTDRPADGRASIADGVVNLVKLYRTRPSLYLFTIFFDAKANELLQLFAESPAIELDRVVKALVEMNPSNSARYQALKEKQAF
ncbi:MAG: DUF4835 family protein [Mangrovibacterium sp.]